MELNTERISSQSILWRARGQYLVTLGFVYSVRRKKENICWCVCECMYVRVCVYVYVYVCVYVYMYVCTRTYTCNVQIS